MPIATLQRQMRELGRIRTGVQVDAGRGKRRPSKLETFRLTSASLELIEAAAAVYGGVVVPWQNRDDAEFEVLTETAVLEIAVPPGQPVSQWFELWRAGGCERRCDGITNVLTMAPCLCPADTEQRLELAKDGEACKATTRLSVMLPELPDLGVWRLESHGYYAAVELAGAAEILAMASATGRLIPARLRLEQRVKRVPGKAPNRYAVPIIEFVETRLGALGIVGEPAPGLLGDGRAPAGGVPAIPPALLPATSDLRAPADPEFEREAAADATLAAVLDGPAIVLDEFHSTSDAQLEAAIPGLSQEELLAFLKERDLAIEFAGTVADRLWPDRPERQLTPAQRAALVRELRRLVPS